MVAKFLKSLGANAASLVAGIRCPGCGEAPMGEWGFCDRCSDRLRSVEGPLCLRCGCAMPPGVSSDRESCSWCEKNKFRFDSLRAAYYYDDPMREAVLAFKFRKKQVLGDMFARVMVEDMVTRPEIYSQHRGVDVVVPVPVHFFRLVVRGFNQSELIARGISAHIGVPLERALVRKKYSRPRAGMTAEERKKSVKGAFVCRRGSALKGRRVLLVDDVATTCSTASECAVVLKKGGAAAVHVLTLARKGGGS